MQKAENVPVQAGGKKGVVACILISLGVILLYHVPYGEFILYPVSLIYTFIHEMGHGIAAILAGGGFDKFVMHADGSGLATSLVPDSRFARAFTAFGGLVAPAMVAAVCMMLGRNAKASRVGLYVFAGICALSLLLVVRNVFGFIFVILCGLAAFGLAKLPKSDAVPQYAMLTFALILLTTVFSRGDYLFVKYASGDAMGAGQLSDVGHIAENLFLPYWFWGALIGLISVIILVLGVLFFFRVPLKRVQKTLPESTEAD